MTLPHANRDATLRALFDEYIEMYASRDDRLTQRFSACFSGYAGGGIRLVTDRDEWISITRQDFSQVKDRIRIEMLDLSLQDLSTEVVVATAFFHIHLPGAEHVLSQEVARLVLIFRLEGVDWKIVHSGISIPYHLVQDGEVYPLKGLQDRNAALETLVAERTRELQESASLYRLLTEDTIDVVWKTDRNLTITYISPADERVRGFRADEVIGHHVFEMFTDEGIAIVKALEQQRPSVVTEPAQQTSHTFTVQHRCKDGRLLWGEVLSKPIYDAAGQLTGWHGTTREVSERRRLENEIKQMAFHDPLTRLPNRRLLDDRYLQEIAAARRTGTHCAAMMLDLDNFKSVNDAHGHAFGDALLVEVARRLIACVREKDTVARLGGDEFVVILGDLDPNPAAAKVQATEVAHKIRQRLGEPYPLSVQQADGELTEVTHRCSASIGVTLFNGVTQRATDVFKHADAAMYQAKDAGRNAVRFCNHLVTT